MDPPAIINFDYAEIAHWMNVVRNLTKRDLPTEQTQRLYDVWRQECFSNMATYSEFRTASLPDGRTVTYTFHMHVFVELCRMHWKLTNMIHQGERLRLERMLPENVTRELWEVYFSLSMTTNPMWIELRSTYVTASQTEGEDETDVLSKQINDKLIILWKKPILEYTQSEAYTVLLFLTQQMICDAEFTKVFRLLWKRMAEMCMYTYDSSVLDMPDMRLQVGADEWTHNRDFLAFCSIYIIQVDRRVFWTNTLSKLPRIDFPAGITAQFTSWFIAEVELMSDDNFETIVHDLLDEAYLFPGDPDWFRFHWPTAVYNRGACITLLRPHLYNLYYSETYMTKKAMIRAAKTQHLARLFVLKTVEQVLQRYHNDLRWCDGIKINNDDIESQDWKFTESVAPLLVQPISNYWVYWQEEVHQTEDIFESVALWFWLLKNDCNSELFKYDLSGVIDEMFPAPKATVVSTSSFVI